MVNAVLEKKSSFNGSTLSINSKTFNQPKLWWTFLTKKKRKNNLKITKKSKLRKTLYFSKTKLTLNHLGGCAKNISSIPLRERFIFVFC